MAVKWTSGRNEQLLLLILGECNIKPNGKTLAQKWAMKFGTSALPPLWRYHHVRSRSDANAIFT